MASTIQIDQKLQVSEEIANSMLLLIDLIRVSSPKLSIVELLAAKARPGLSAEILSSNIIARFDEVGIPTGPLEENTPNVMESLIKVMCEEIVDALQNDMRIDIVVDQGITLQANGGNSGGPVVAIGSTLQNGTGVGVAS